MCGRFSLTATPQEVSALFELADLGAFPPRYNIAPTQPMLMVGPGPAGTSQGLLVRWGFVPSWVKDPKDFTLIINARSETANEKPSFKTAMRHRRMLIPASGFYEWHRPKDGGPKQAYWIRPRDRSICVFGGLMETWSGANGSEIDTGCILTTAANKTLAPIHHRMPVVIRPEDFDEWMDCKTREPRDIAHLMQPIGNDYFEAIAVSDRVNKVANSDPQLQQPLPPEDVAHAVNQEADKSDKKPGKNNDQLDLF